MRTTGITLIVLACLGAGCREHEEGGREPSGVSKPPATATSEPSAVAADSFDATDATQAVKKHILLTEGQDRLRQVVGSWWSGPSDGGSVTVRFRTDGANEEDVVYWAMRTQRDGDYTVFSEFPAHLDHPTVHHEIAASVLKKLGYHLLEWGSNWSAGEAFPLGSEAVTRIHYRERAPEGQDDYRGQTTIPIATHIAYCTLRKEPSGWTLQQVELKRQIQGEDHAVNEEEIRTIGRGEIERLIRH